MQGLPILDEEDLDAFFLDDGHDWGLFKAYFDTLVSLDKTQRIYEAVWARFAAEIN